MALTRIVRMLKLLNTELKSLLVIKTSLQTNAFISLYAYVYNKGKLFFNRANWVRQRLLGGQSMVCSSRLPVE